jgi:hypothetical protein
MDCGQHFLAALDAIPSKMSSVPADLKDFIMGHIITDSIIGVNRLYYLLKHMIKVQWVVRGLQGMHNVAFQGAHGPRAPLKTLVMTAFILISYRIFHVPLLMEVQLSHTTH